MSFYFTPIGGFMVGSFDRNLNVLFQNLILPDFTHTEIFGFSNTNNSLILNYAVNDEHLQYYQSFSKTNGDSIKSATLGFNYINNQIIKGYSYGHFPLGPANPLPENLKPGQGHFIYSEVDRKLKFVQVDENVNLTVKFPLLLPEFDEIISYRQLFTDEGTIIVGVSYGYKGRNYFTLQEITKNGELMK